MPQDKDVHPREQAVTQAELAISIAVLEIREKYGLTSSELVTAISRVMADEARYMLRDIRS